MDERVTMMRMAGRDTVAFIVNAAMLAVFGGWLCGVMWLVMWLEAKADGGSLDVPLWLSIYVFGSVGVGGIAIWVNSIRDRIKAGKPDT